MLRGLIVGILVTTTGAQLAINASRTRTFVPVVVGRESQQQFLHRTVSNYDDMEWANTNLPSDARILSLSLHPYFFDVPYTFGPAAYSGLIDYEGLVSASDFLNQLQSFDITHIAISEKDIVTYMVGLSSKFWPETNLGQIGADLVTQGYLVQIYRNAQSRVVTSRSLGWSTTGEYRFYQVRYDPDESATEGSSISAQPKVSEVSNVGLVRGEGL